MRLRNLLLAWLLVPLVALWALGYRIVNLRSIDEVNEAYDRTLLGSALAMAERVSVDRGELSVDLPYAALQMLESGAQDRIFYRISSTGDARLTTGYDDLPPPPALPKNDAPLFYDARYLGEPIRLVALLKPLYDAKDAPLMVQVGETMAAREALARRILIDSAAPQLALIGAAALLVVFGVRRGLEPLRRLRREVQARGDSDLTPIDASGVPREVAPLIEAINLHAERQREMTEAQRRFIADASHQLKTPLTVLKTQAALALAQADAQAMRGIVRQMHNSTDVTARVIQQLLALAKSEPGLELPAERADLVEIARAATFELLPQALKKSVELGFDADGAAPVEGQPLLLRELVANLVDNAVRYARGGGNVAVSVRRTDDASVQLVVEDDGPGIAPAEREKVFERFYRAGGASSEGSGLGLAIVRQIAERHRATIRIDAGAGGAGTRVTVRMPGSTALHDESEARRGSRSNPWRARIEQPADRPPTS
jgi:two-component system sensor histidine kinase TctE